MTHGIRALAVDCFGLTFAFCPASLLVCLVPPPICALPAMPANATGHNSKEDSVLVVNANAALNLATNQSYKENVFLFAPNLIGALCALRGQVGVLTVGDRVHPGHPRRAFSSLHELSPKILHNRICHIVLTRRCRRASGSLSWRGIQVWRCARHGDRQVRPPRSFISRCILTSR